jgi:hypothetical protein
MVGIVRLLSSEGVTMRRTRASGVIGVPDRHRVFPVSPRTRTGRAGTLQVMHRRLIAAAVAILALVIPLAALATA